MYRPDKLHLSHSGTIVSTDNFKGAIQDHSTDHLNVKKADREGKSTDTGSSGYHRFTGRGYDQGNSDRAFVI